MKRSARGGQTLRCRDVTKRDARYLLNHLSELGVRLSKGSDLDIVSASIDPRSYTDVFAFHRDWAAVNLLAKYPGLDLGVDRDRVAFDSFLAAERACYQSNLRLLRPSASCGVEAVIHTARRKIESLLGEFSWDRCRPYFGFSNGASTRLRRRDAAAPLKFIPKDGYHVTRRAASLALREIASSPLWLEYIRAEKGDNPSNWIKVVEGNAVTTVPKSAKTNRVIAKEPDLNMFLQRGIGGLLRSTLKKVGVDLDTQVKNQVLALEGSLHDVLSTIDLASASDSISLELCQLLLPSDWYEALVLVRSPCGRLPDGKIISYQKVSSMGNGFTFELESLLFWALTRSSVEQSEHVTDRRIAIYGDDIVCDKNAVPLLVSTLAYCGFSTNSDKSFVDGPFRESCGKHYFLGCDVTPFYIRKPIDSVPRLYWLCNSFRRWAARPTGYGSESDYFVWSWLVKQLPKRYARLSIPEGMGDGGLLLSLAESRPKFHNSGFAGIRVEPKSDVKAFPSKESYLNALLLRRETFEVDETRHSIYTIKEELTLRAAEAAFSDERRDAVSDRYLIRRYRTSVWVDPSPWLLSTI